MTGALIADASIAIGWVHPRQATEETAAALDAIAAGAGLEVPALWPLEVANTLAVLVRRGMLSEARREEALAWLRVLPVRFDHEMAGLAFTRLSELAMLHQLTVYDATYLELAQRRRQPLACKDGSLRAAARRAAVELWDARG